MLILDASVALAWLIPDESDPGCDAVLPKVEAEGAAVPAIWALEIGNILLLAERHARITSPGRLAAQAMLLSLPIEQQPADALSAWGDAASLALRHRLSLYDATYLELAIRRALPIASRDKALRSAAKAEGVPVLP